MFNMQTIFHHFLANTWNFANTTSDHATAMMSHSERQEFKIDVQLIDWDVALRN